MYFIIINPKTRLATSPEERMRHAEEAKKLGSEIRVEQYAPDKVHVIKDTDYNTPYAERKAFTFSTIDTALTWIRSME